MPFDEPYEILVMVFFFPNVTYRKEADMPQTVEIHGEAETVILTISVR